MKTPAVKTKKAPSKKETKQPVSTGDFLNVPFKADLVHQVAVGLMANRRQGNAHAKDRSEVSGGGKKPWRQKGTGRARHGSTRSPLWRGGGITFGPRNERIYSKTIPNKMRKQALLMALSAKKSGERMIEVAELSVKEIKTKQVIALLKDLKINGTILFITADYNQTFWKAARNIAGVTVVEARNLNLVDVLSAQYLVIEKVAQDKLKAALAG